MSKHCLKCGKRAYSDYCMQHKPRKPISKIGKQGKLNQATSKEFRDSLEPDRIYVCYLQIHPYCLRQLRYEQVVPEHVEAKSRSPHLRHNLKNIWVSCVFCNGLKGSRSLENLAKEYPHLKKYLT